MASTVGHSLSGICIYALVSQKILRSPIFHDGKGLFLYAFLANLPDIDFLIGFLFYGEFNAIHGGVTHSLFFLITISVLLGGMGRVWPYSLNPWRVFFLVGSHDLIDFFSSSALGFHPAYGIALFYPFSSEKIGAPISLFYGVRHKDLDQLFSFDNIRGIFYELVIFVPVMVFFYFLRRKRVCSGWPIKREDDFGGLPG